MIEPQPAQLGASAWVWKLTFVAPRVRVIGEVPPPFPLAVLAAPLPLTAWPFAWPLVATTASSSVARDPAAAVAFGASEASEASVRAGSTTAAGALSGSDVAAVTALEEDSAATPAAKGLADEEADGASP